eukprot:gene15122-16678_t
MELKSFESSLMLPTIPSNNVPASLKKADKYWIELEGEQRPQVECRYMLVKETKPGDEPDVVPPGQSAVENTEDVNSLTPSINEDKEKETQQDDAPNEPIPNPEEPQPEPRKSLSICKMIAIIIAVVLLFVIGLGLCIVASYFNLVSQEVLQDTVHHMISLAKHGITIALPKLMLWLPFF